MPQGPTAESFPPALQRIVERAVDRDRAHGLVLEALTHRTWLNENPVRAG
jgi:hypothetical protein